MNLFEQKTEKKEVHAHTKSHKVCHKMKASTSSRGFFSRLMFFSKIWSNFKKRMDSAQSSNIDYGNLG